MRRATGWRNEFFELESFRVMVEHRPGQPMAMDQNPLGHYDGVETEATIKVLVGDERVVATGEGNGPVNALDAAFRQALARVDQPRFDVLKRVRLTDYKVRIIDSAEGTGAITRVLIDASDGERHWSTVGVSENIIEASWQALADSMIYALTS